MTWLVVILLYMDIFFLKKYNNFMTSIENDFFLNMVFLDYFHNTFYNEFKAKIILLKKKKS